MGCFHSRQRAAYKPLFNPELQQQQKSKQEGRENQQYQQNRDCEIVYFIDLPQHQQNKLAELVRLVASSYFDLDRDYIKASPPCLFTIKQAFQRRYRNLRAYLSEINVNKNIVGSISLNPDDKNPTAFTLSTLLNDFESRSQSLQKNNPYSDNKELAFSGAQHFLRF